MSARTMEWQKRPSQTFVPTRSLAPQRRFDPPQREQRVKQVTPSSFGHDFGGVAVDAASLSPTAEYCPLATPRACPFGGACHTCPTRIQPKLAAGREGDEFEREAEYVAEQVMRMNAPDNPRGPAQFAQESTSSTCGEQQEPLRNKPLQTAIHATIGAPRMVEEVLRAPGEPLQTTARGFMERRFGHDFSAVRVHADGPAAASARATGALAYTVGRDIVFAAGEYAPAADSGRHLIAHELAHVLQQGGGRCGSPVQLRTAARLQALGANPGCSAAERATIHQAVFNARGWLLKASAALETTPLPARAISALRRNFGPTYGVPADAQLIAGRLRVAYREISNIPIGCAGAADATCATAPCGYSVAGSHAATICRNATLAAGTDWRFQAGCVLHESLHAAFSRFTVDEYSGWHGVSGSTATYPGAGTDPLLNADSYTTLVMDLS